MPEDPDQESKPSYKGSHLTVQTASAERMLAMKLHAGRPSDLKDIQQLVRFTNIRNGEEAKRLTEHHFPHTEVPAERVKVVDEAITKAASQAVEDVRAPANAPEPATGSAAKTGKRNRDSGRGIE